jgi:hypothetical protein
VLGSSSAAFNNQGADVLLTASLCFPKQAAHSAFNSKQAPGSTSWCSIADSAQNPPVNHIVLK